MFAMCRRGTIGRFSRATVNRLKRAILTCWFSLRFFALYVEDAKKSVSAERGEVFVKWIPCNSLNKSFVVPDDVRRLAFLNVPNHCRVVNRA